VATATAPAEPATTPVRNEHPLLMLTARRLGFGVITLFVVSVIVFWATQVLPGNAAYAVLGRNANPARLHALERQLHLNQGLLAQYWAWLSGLFTGKLGASLANGQPVWGSPSPGSSTRRPGLRHRCDRHGDRGPWGHRRAAQGQLV
jgi:peptide/nickel transport system permease protein